MRQLTRNVRLVLRLLANDEELMRFGRTVKENKFTVSILMPVEIFVKESTCSEVHLSVEDGGANLLISLRISTALIVFLT